MQHSWLVVVQWFYFSTESRLDLSGGNINQAYCLSNKQVQYFAKINKSRLENMFSAECVGLKALATSKTFRTPEVITKGVLEDKSYLVLEFVEMNAKGNTFKLTKALANLHLQTQSSFGFESDNFIGLSIQQNKWCKNEGEFFTKHRLKPQLKKLEFTHSLVQTKKLLKKISVFLNQHQPIPCLVHGDLWQGNIGYLSDGLPLIDDPACYYADYEVDLVMLEPFGNPGFDFFEHYQKYHSIQSGNSMRREIYSLYHILNHANMFGGLYIQ